MFVELNNLMGHGISSLPRGKFILITDDMVDGSFIISHFLSLYLKSGNSVCMLGMAQSSNHYNNVCSKFGINCNQFRNKGNFIFIEMLTLLKQRSTVTARSESEKILNQKMQNILTAPEKSVSDLILCFTEYCDSVTSSDSNLLFLIDDLSLFLTLGFTLEQIADFIHYIMVKLNVPSQQSGNLLVAMVHCDGDTDEKHDEFLWSYLTHKSTLMMEFQGLKTGYSKDIHGQLHIQWKDDDYNITREEKRQYKVEEKTLKLFAYGMSAASV